VATTELFAYNGAHVLANPLRIQAGPLNFNSAETATARSTFLGTGRLEVHRSAALDQNRR